MCSTRIPASLGSASTSRSQILPGLGLALPPLVPFHLPGGSRTQPDPAQVGSRAVTPSYPSKIPSSIPSSALDHPELQLWMGLESWDQLGTRSAEIRGAGLAMARTCSLRAAGLIKCYFGVTHIQVSEAEPDHNNYVIFLFS